MSEEILGKTTTEIMNRDGLSGLELVEFMSTYGFNACDKCKKIYLTHELIWITAEDFKPAHNEIITKEMYEKYDALCYDCYIDIAVIDKK